MQQQAEGKPSLFGCLRPGSVLKPAWWMVVAHFGTAAQPGSPAPVNITAVEIVLHEPCRKRPAGIRTATGLRAESVSVYEGGEKKKRLLPLMLITTPQSKPNNTKWKPQRAHLWWLHYDICWRLCDVHGLHLPPLFFDCLSCTRNMADRR